MAIYHNGIKISNLYHNGKKINKIFHNGKCIYASIVAVGQSLYDGIPSNGIMLYGDIPGWSSSNPLGIQGDSINLKAPLSSCPNGINIHFSNTSYRGDGTSFYSNCEIYDINIPKGSSSGHSPVTSIFTHGGIEASINGSALSFSTYNGDYYKGTVSSLDSGGYNQEILAILSITAY